MQPMPWWRGRHLTVFFESSGRQMGRRLLIGRARHISSTSPGLPAQLTRRHASSSRRNNVRSARTSLSLVGPSDAPDREKIRERTRRWESGTLRYNGTMAGQSRSIGRSSKDKEPSRVSQFTLRAQTGTPQSEQSMFCKPCFLLLCLGPS